MENVGLAKILRHLDLPLGGMAESGREFRISSLDFGSALTEKSECLWTHISHDHSLKVESHVRVVGSTLIISRTIENTGPRLSTSIEHQFTMATDGPVSLIGWFTVFVRDNTTALVEDDMLPGSRQIDMGISGKKDFHSEHPTSRVCRCHTILSVVKR